MFKNKMFIKEVCVKLGFRIEMINDVYKYINSFTESKTFSIFAEEVINHSKRSLLLLVFIYQVKSMRTSKE